MRALLLIALASVGMFAAASTTLSVAPAAPVVITGNYTDPATGDIVYAPWVEANFTVNTTQELTITDMHVQVWDNLDQSEMSYDHHINPPVTVEAGQPYVFANTYIVNMPINDGYVYNVIVTYNGWYGSATAPSGRMVVSKQFQTK
jgi:hypothetical protein